MPESFCPRCGSNQVSNDECLQCGVIISRFLEPLPPPRYTMTGSPIRNAMEAAQEHHRRMRRARMQTRLIGLGMLLALMLVGYATYRTIKKGTAPYIGPYKNVEHVFGLGFAKEGWNHYSAGDLKDFGIGGVADAFWHGDDPDDPEILLLVHRGSVGVRVPDPFQGEGVDRLQQATEDHLQSLMKDAGYEVDFTSGKRTGLTAGPGFRFEADLTKNERQRAAVFYCGYRPGGGLYAVIFIGTPEAMHAHEEELEKLGKSLNFHISVI